MSTEYTPPIQLDSGRVEIDTTPDSDGDIELIATLEDMHVAYLRPADQIALRDLLNRLQPVEPRTITTVEELAALHAGAVVPPTDQARLLAAVQAVTAIHKPRRHDPVMDGVWHRQSDAGQYDLCAHDRQRFPCPTVAAVVAALGGEA